MTLEEVLLSECVGMSNEAAYTHIKSKVIPDYQMAASGDVLAYIASQSKLSVFKDLAIDSTNPLMDVADAAIITLKAREGFDFSSAATAQLMGAFVAGAVITQEEADYIKNLAKVMVPEFPTTTMRDVVGARNPADLVSSFSNIENTEGKNRYHDLELIVSGDVPASTYANIMIRHSESGVWRRIDGFPNITQGDVMYRRVHGEFIKENTQIKCQCAYNISMSLLVQAV